MAVDPYTIKKRAARYIKVDFVGDILAKQKANHLNTVRLVKRVQKGLMRLEKIKEEPQKKSFKKALFVSRIASKLADAGVDAQIGIAKFEKMSERERHWTWNSLYESAMNHLKERPIIKSDPLLQTNIAFLEKFFTLPNKIHRMREKHWKIISKVKERSIIKNHDPREGLAKEIDRLIIRTREHEPLKVRAMDVCIAASIYADIMEKKGQNWSGAYQDGMEIVYSKIKEIPALVYTIANI